MSKYIRILTNLNIFCWTGGSIFLPRSSGIPSETPETLCGRQEHLGWIMYKVSLGTRPGSTNSTCAGNVLVPWKDRQIQCHSLHYYSVPNTKKKCKKT